VVGVMARVDGDVNSTVLVIAIKVGFIVEASFGEVSWGWGLGRLTSTIN
jgi:hypothetical protein